MERDLKEILLTEEQIQNNHLRERMQHFPYNIQQKRIVDKREFKV